MFPEARVISHIWWFFCSFVCFEMRQENRHIMLLIWLHDQFIEDCNAFYSIFLSVAIRESCIFFFFPTTYTGTWNSWSARIQPQQCTVGSGFPSFGSDHHLDCNRRQAEIMLEVKIQIWELSCAAQAHFFTHLFRNVAGNVCCNQSNPTFILLNWLHPINKNVIHFLVHCLFKFSLNK